MQLEEWVLAQPAWSDVLIVLMTGRGDAPERIVSPNASRTPSATSRFWSVHSMPPHWSASRARRCARAGVSFDARVVAAPELLARELQHRTKNLLSVVCRSVQPACGTEGKVAKPFWAPARPGARPGSADVEATRQGAQMSDVVEQVRGGLRRACFDRRAAGCSPPHRIAPGCRASHPRINVQHRRARRLQHPRGSSFGAFVGEFYSFTRSGASAFSGADGAAHEPARPARRAFGAPYCSMHVARPVGPRSFHYGAEGFTYEILAAHAVSTP